MQELKVPVNSDEFIVIDSKEEERKIIAEEGSTVDLILIQDEDMETNLKTRIECIPKKDATINLSFFIFGGNSHEFEIENILEEEGGHSINNGVFIGADEQKFDIKTISRHRAPNTECKMFVKGALNDSAISDYEGLIDISKEGENARGYQKEEALVLSDRAKANSLPLLNVRNDNVEVQHGATIGQLDEEKLFYMMSRGLTEEEAKIKVIEGFFNPLMKDLDKESKEEIREKIRKKMVN